MLQGDSGSDPSLSHSSVPQKKMERDPEPESAMQPSPRLIRRSEHRRVPQWFFQIEDDIFFCVPLEIEEPTFFIEAIDSPNRKEWMDAMRDELDSMVRNEVSELVDLPPRGKAIGNKWVFKVKHRTNGSLDKFKAHLVAKGYTEVEGVDYAEIFSLVVRLAFVRLLLALVAHLDLELFQMDVLNGNLEEEIYMDQQIGFVSKGQEGKVCHLKNPYMVSNSLQGHGTLDSMKPSMHLAYPWFQKTTVYMLRKQTWELCFLLCMSTTFY